MIQSQGSFPGSSFYYPGRRQVSAALAAFIDAIRAPAEDRSGISLT
jgi:hypothetical protein